MKTPTSETTHCVDEIDGKRARKIRIQILQIFEVEKTMIRPGPGKICRLELKDFQ